MSLIYTTKRETTEPTETYSGIKSLSGTIGEVCETSPQSI